MKRNLIALLSGLLFGLGLSLSRMVDPAKVLGFLDVAGAWDPSLALVMGGALLVAAIVYRFAYGRGRPVLAASFSAPPPGVQGVIDARLLGGAALFGLGWGLVGFCPGPALAALGLLRWEAALFALAMIAGMAAQGIPLPGSSSGHAAAHEV